jgi:hypothetical protein
MNTAGPGRWKLLYLVNVYRTNTVGEHLIKKTCDLAKPENRSRTEAMDASQPIKTVADPPSTGHLRPGYPWFLNTYLQYGFRRLPRDELRSISSNDLGLSIRKLHRVPQGHASF